MAREDIYKGTRLCLLSDFLDVPQGTRATVEDLGVLSGDWSFIVRFDSYWPIPAPNWNPRSNKRPIRHGRTSLRLGAEDLARFELITQVEDVEAPPLPLPGRPLP